MEPIAVDVVMEAPAASYCSDADRARASLEEALAAARAPRHASKKAPDARWAVTLGPSAPAAGFSGRSLDAVIVDDVGAIVARRTISDRAARTCMPLAKAVGAWASLVLDAELARAKDDDDLKTSSPPSSDVASSSRVSAREREVRDSGVIEEGGPRPRPSSIELGSMAYVRNGLSSTGGVGGLTAFATIEVSPGWILRPALAFGRSTTRVPVTATESAALSHVGSRVDFCRRIPGNYIERRGIELDLCAGLDGGIVTSDAFNQGRSGTAPRLGFGPAANLRGELGAGIALEVRSLLGANFLTMPVLDELRAPLVFAAAELGVSVRLR
ncbi:MAG: hypothetical protein JST00_17330 [Deltaproteobacteria bacterium]|nr:hypothetical protein [Deltaproteobacteria bacterium]